jgi:peptidoglycan/LPS O-acetylase OafA/YrhL
MGLFGIGNLLLKFKRKNFQDRKARGISVVFAVSLIVAAFIGNVQLNVDSLYFYKIPVPSCYLYQ